jgi:hypothetical protein
MPVSNTAAPSHGSFVDLLLARKSKKERKRKGKK